MISRQFIEELNRDADIVSVIGQHVKLAAKGNSHIGLCPFHQEKTPSFNVVPSKGFYHCFGCGASGTALGFLMNYVHGGDFVAAVEDLARLMGRKVVRDGSRKGPRLPTWRLEKAFEHYHAMLKKSGAAREYLKGRGLGRETAVRFGLGYAPADGGLAEAFDDYGDAKAKADLVRVGLLKEGERGDHYTYFRDRVMFPIRSNTGKVLGFGGRLMGDGEPKYLNSPQSDVFDKGAVVYGLREATQGFRDEGFAMVVEGYMDVVMLAQAGLRNAVATMGTAATTQQVRTIMTRSQDVVFCFDGDAAGTRAMAKALKNVMPALKDGQSVRFARLPDGHDPDSFVREKGADELRSLARGAMPLEQALVDPGLFGVKGDDAAAESAMLKNAAELLALVDAKRARMLRASLCNRVAQARRIDVGVINDAVSEAAGRLETTAERPQRLVRSKTASYKMKADHLRELLVCLAMDRKLLEKAKKTLKVANLKNDTDFTLCMRVIENLEFARASGEKELTVVSLLREKKFDAVAGYIEREVKKREKFVKDSPESNLQSVMRYYKKEADKKRRKQETKERLRTA